MYIKKFHKVPHPKKENHKICLLLQIVQILAVLRVISTVFRVKKGVFCSFSKSFYSCLGVGKALFLPLKYQLLIVFSAQNFTPLTFSFEVLRKPYENPQDFDFTIHEFSSVPRFAKIVVKPQKSSKNY